MTGQDRYIRHETRMQTFRWATPMVLFILTASVGFFGYIGNDYLSQIRNSIVDLKNDGNNHYDKLWSAIKSSQNKVDCVQNQLARCCKDSVYCS